MPTEETQIQFLIRRGLMPSVAKRVVADAQKLSNPLSKPRARSQATITAQDIETAAKWWLFNTAVPLRIKRILDAVEV